MSNSKTATLSFRIEPDLKQALRAAAEQEHRSIANMVEVMIREHCGRVGIAVAEPAPVRASPTFSTRRCFRGTRAFRRVQVLDL